MLGQRRRQWSSISLALVSLQRQDIHANTMYLLNIGSMLGQHHRWCANFDLTLGIFCLNLFQVTPLEPKS